MPWKPVADTDGAIARDFKAIADALIEARRVLDPRDPVQGPVWKKVDDAEARLQGLASVLGREGAGGA